MALASSAQILPVPAFGSHYSLAHVWLSGLQSLAHWSLSQKGSALTCSPPLLMSFLSMPVALQSFPLGRLLACGLVLVGMILWSMSVDPNRPSASGGQRLCLHRGQHIEGARMREP